MRGNPPHKANSPTLEYLRTYVQEMVYIDPYNLGELPGTVYWKLRWMPEADNPPRVMRIMQLHPSADWERICTNLHECWTTEAVKINRYVVIQDILPTNKRLHKIRLVDSPRCGLCGEPDTVQHRVTACGDGARIWLWTKRRIAWILCIGPAHIPPPGQREPSSGYGHLNKTGRFHGYWPKWCGTELKKVEHTLTKIRATFCDGDAGGRIRPNIAGPTLGTILRSYDHDPTRGHNVERQRRGDSCYSALVTVGVERKSTHKSKVRGPQEHEGIRAEASLGLLGEGMDVTQYFTWAAKCVNLALLRSVK